MTPGELLRYTGEWMRPGKARHGLRSGGDKRGYILVSTYCFPNVDKDELKKLLGEIEDNVLTNNNRKKIVIGGDLNARAKLWDNINNARGYILGKWIHGKDMVILNDGKTATCVRAQGSFRTWGRDRGHRGSG